MRSLILRFAVIGTLLGLPLSLLAAGSITVNDSIAGLGATVRIQGFVNQTDLTLVVSTPETSLTYPTHTDSDGNASINVKSADSEAAGTYTATLKQGGITLAAKNFEILPDTMSAQNSDVESLTRSISPDGRDEATVVVTLRDRYGNPLPGRPVTLIPSRTEDSVTPMGSETNAQGEMHFSVSTQTAGTIVVRAVDLLSGNTLAASATIDAGGMGGNAPVRTSYNSSSNRRYIAQVDSGNGFDVIDHFEVIAPKDAVAGEEMAKVTIIAKDKNGNTVQDYVGTILFSAPNDRDAYLPNFGHYTFTDADQGIHSFPIVAKFQTIGDQILRVEDENDSTIYGETHVNVTGSTHNASGTIEITNFKDGDAVNTLSITVEGNGPRLANLIVMGGTKDVTGDSDQDGKFSIPVTLPANQHDFTIRVRDDAGRSDSGPIHLVLDQDAPALKTITFAPERPQEGDKVLLVVESEPKLPSVVMHLTDPTTNITQDFTLSENPSSPGSYQTIFTAPANGSYQPVVTAMDSAKNKTEVRSILNVGAQGLPKVKSVHATGKINSVELTWDPLQLGKGQDMTGYRIYVGDSATNFTYTLDTGRPATKATVAGLSPGKTYFFAITGLMGDKESDEKSDISQAKVLGLALDITAGDSSLMLKWPTVSSPLPLSSFMLEYGTEGDTYTEKRLINGELLAFTIHDLLNGVKYFVRLTPITTTGDQLTDLAAKGEGTPIGSGFHPGPTDPIPFDPNRLPTPKGELSSNGIPAFAWMTIAPIGLLGAGYHLHRRKARRHTAAFLRMIQAQYR